MQIINLLTHLINQKLTICNKRITKLKIKSINSSIFFQLIGTSKLPLPASVFFSTFVI